MDYVGRILADRYRLERPLAEGGMGAIWIGRHLSLDRDVAIKLISRASDKKSPDSTTQSSSTVIPEEVRKRFEREAKAAAQLQSPHIVQIFDYGVDNDIPYIAMELLEGQDLRQLLKQQPRYHPADVLMLATPIGKALALAHDRGLIHRDIKPGNIFIARIGKEDVVKVLDFGLAKSYVQSDGMTSPEVILGSPHYISPEQIMCLPVDPRTDLWSFGVVLFRLLTGKLPFVGQTVVDTAELILNAPSPRATEICPSLPPSADAFFERCLSKDPNGRFANALDMLVGLREVVVAADDASSSGGEIPRISTRPPPPPVSAATSSIVLPFGGRGPAPPPSNPGVRQQSSGIPFQVPSVVDDPETRSDTNVRVSVATRSSMRKMGVRRLPVKPIAIAAAGIVAVTTLVLVVRAGRSDRSNAAIENRDFRTTTTQPTSASSSTEVAPQVLPDPTASRTDWSTITQTSDAVALGSTAFSSTPSVSTASAPPAAASSSSPLKGPLPSSTVKRPGRVKIF